MDDRLWRWGAALMLLASALIGLAGCGGPAPSTHRGEPALERLKFGVAPYFPTQAENRKQFQPLADAFGKAAGVPVELVLADDWVGISEALRAGTLDVAWLGPWGYVLAHHNEPAIQAVATVKYKGKPTYQAVLMARADAPFNTLDEAVDLSKKGPKLKLSLADVGSTSGWLIPQAEFKRRGIDPKTVFKYHEGASHAAQAIALVSGQTDLASDYDRNLDVLAAGGKLDRSKIKIVWTSEPLPNDPIVVRGGFPASLKTKFQKMLEDLTPEQAETLLPKNYTGFVSSDGSNYALIESDGKRVGKLK
jgi:phosphonate transport system substrate-binding protein